MFIDHLSCTDILINNVIGYENDSDLIYHASNENGDQILFHYSPDNLLLKAKFICANNQILLREYYFYNDHGHINKILCDNGSSQDIDDLSNVTERFIKQMTYNSRFPALNLPETVEEFYLDLSTQKEILLRKIFNHYNITAENIQQDFYDSNGNYQYSIYNKYNEHKDLLVSSNSTSNMLIKNNPSEGFNNKNSLNFHSYDLNSFLSTLYSKVDAFDEKFLSFFHSINDFINNYLSLEFNLKTKIEEAALDFFGRNTLLLHGFYLDKHETGTFGEGEINDKVRITLINGILNARLDIMESAEMISKFHGGNNIHYIFRPTEGWTKDFIKCGLVKGGWVSPQAKQLAVLWLELISEMGGVNQGGKIIHYAHSIGAVDSLMAKKFLSSEELSMIQVYTFGSPSILQPEGFHSVTNYISKGDGVSYLDPISYIQSMINPIEHTLFIPSSWPLPLVDHQLTFPAYKSILETLGKQFLEKYGDTST